MTVDSTMYVISKPVVEWIGSLVLVVIAAAVLTLAIWRTTKH